MTVLENNIKKVLVHVLLWICFSMFSISVASIEIGDVPNEMITRLIFNPILFYSNSLLLVPYLLLKKRIGLYIVFSILLLLVFNYLIISIFGVSFFRFLNHPVQTENGLLKIHNIRYIAPTVFSLSFFLLGGVFGLANDFYRRERNDKIKVKEQKEMELQFLRTQLKPHFLFNTLNSIYFLVRSKSEDAPEAVITLSELMRYMLYEVGKNKVSLEREIEYINNYISLQKLRLADSEHIKLVIDEDCGNLKIYPLLLISFIENAFKHGTTHDGRTFIDITITVDEGFLFFKVRNIIGLKKKDIDNSGIGMDNIKSQLEYLYGGNYSLTTCVEEEYYNVYLEIYLL
ncbi:sensor histidine kinase [Maribacter polysaccharolyticus]|uniref:sensor histidine kinase n=1 Tax=Maribacter polysaccharolyticus TaxID=3020831 RepID=UPI00237F3C37|nr:histidine kinase [Maribacter polysaccharolyticus]MDE3741141.1 histidine kinase [Maribacter polysaccharolyticus]